MNNQIPFNGATLEPIRLVDEIEIIPPTACDVYIDGKVIFQNVFVKITPTGHLYLYKNYSEKTNNNGTWYVADQLIAVVSAENYIIKQNTD